MLRNLNTLRLSHILDSTQVMLLPRDFFDRLSLYSTVDVLTYTFNPSIRFIFRLGRVVCAKNVNPKDSEHKIQIKHFPENHAKLYIAQRRLTTDVFIGSCNANIPTMRNEIMIQVYKQKKELIKLFNNLWKQLE